MHRNNDCLTRNCTRKAHCCHEGKSNPIARVAVLQGKGSAVIILPRSITKSVTLQQGTEEEAGFIRDFVKTELSRVGIGEISSPKLGAGSETGGSLS